jgi:DNA polymerase III gamma/tau subunit
VRIEPQAVDMLSREAQGSMRDALSLLDQVLAAFGEEITLKDVSWLIGVADHTVHADLTRAVLGRDPAGCLEIIGGLDRDGYNLPHFTSGYLEHVRDLIVVKSAGAGTPGAAIAEWEREDLEQMVKDTTLPELYRVFSHVARAADEIARSPMPRVLLETTFIKLAQDEPLTTVARLLQAVGDLKRRGGLPSNPTAAAGGGAPSSPPAARTGGPREGASGATPADPAPQAAEPEADPPPEPPAAPPPASQEQAWEAIVERIGTVSPFLHRVLQKATPLVVDAERVHVGFDGESEFDSSFACEKDNVRIIQEVSEGVLGSRPRVTVERASEEAIEARRQERDRRRRREEELRERALDNTVIREARDLFGAEIRDIKTDVE